VIKISAVMRDLLSKALADGTPCLVGTASKEGHPQISPKGSLAVFDEQTLCYWERSHRSSQAHIEGNAHVVVYYRNAARAKENPYRSSAIRFHGTARIVRSGPERERAWQLTNSEEQSKDPDKKGFAVLIDVERIEELSGAVIMTRDG
jgi:Pyridoxamine 5'-phosphate oxidase